MTDKIYRLSCLCHELIEILIDFDNRVHRFLLKNGSSYVADRWLAEDAMDEINRLQRSFFEIMGNFDLTDSDENEEFLRYKNPLPLGWRMKDD
tara:strand:- start:111 stop:389 length:279 start_codon:yes stop_codon:yes gene_type:complete